MAAYEGPFEEIRLESEHCRLSLHWHVGEGYTGDYDGDAENDAPLLRFDVSHKTEKDWGDVEPKAESYCTALNARWERSRLIEEAQQILNNFEESHDQPWGKIAERESWAGTSG